MCAPINNLYRDTPRSHGQFTAGPEKSFLGIKKMFVSHEAECNPSDIALDGRTMIKVHKHQDNYYMIDLLR